MSDKFSIKKVTSENFHDLIYLVKQLANYEQLDPPDDTAIERLKEDGLSDEPKYFAYLGILNSKPVAYLIYFLNYSSFLGLPTLYIEDIFVLEEIRRRGFGQKLFDFCISQAKALGCGRMEWCVLDWNEPAIRFYEKNNAQQLNWKFFRYSIEK